MYTGAPTREASSEIATDWPGFRRTYVPVAVSGQM
jgi:hypothetical protein